ncbi:uncharacterized protein LOC110043535 [Orbicella faveolata]|uniref:uncharacterized protein LOC110043535 n=1 Tax=Orbicella faveolata TaxID=48498 RepID=UPI0009E448E0|nr:uncharacterized protein LOC110043535 [Orbicella faveolata]
MSSSSSSCVTPLRGQSPDLPSIQIQFSDEQESSNQSNECSEIPVSIEACDEKRDVPIAPTNINSSSPARQKRSNSQPSGKRKSLSPTKDILRVCKHELTLKARCKEAADKEKDVHPVSTNEDAEFPVGIDIKMDGIEDLKMKATVAVNTRRPCKYRPIKRDEDVEHRCPACSPLPDDSFFKLINRERLCLKEDICKELDRSYKELAILGRVESGMKEYEANSNPAERVLEKLRALHPGMKLKEFEQMLLHIKRLDVVDVIHNHHLSCTLCRRNRFDVKA